MKFLLFSFLFISTAFSQQWHLVADSIQFPEGPAWDGKNTTYVSSCYGGYIKTLQNNTSSILVDSLSKLIKQTNGLTFGKDGYLYACDYGLGKILKISTKGKVEVYADGFEGLKFNRPNDLAFDKYGNLFFTDPKSYGNGVIDGRIFKIDRKTKKVILMDDSLNFPNGIAFDKSGTKLFVCESGKQRILEYDVVKDKIRFKKIFVELPGGDPDGIAFGNDGNLYVAHFGMGQIVVISKDGKIIDAIKAPGKKPSNVEFIGKDRRTLLITEDETNSVYTRKNKTSGIKLAFAP